VSDLLDGLCGMFNGGGCCCGHSHGCCDAGCGDSCGGCNGGGCNGGGEYHGGEEADEPAPAAPAEAAASIRPIPPRPMSDPNARVARQRNVVRTSFVR
jgi:hypothetical protein